MTTVVPLAYTVKEAAEAARVGVDTIRAAIHSVDPKDFPPPLRAKRVGHGVNARHLIRVSELDAWLSKFPDA